MPGAPSSWIAYVNVEDVRASTAKAKTLGAKVMKDVTKVPERGGSALLRTRRERCWVCGNPRIASR